MPGYTAESKLGELLKDEKAKAILEKYFPGISTNPGIEWSLHQTLKNVAKYPIPQAFGYPMAGVQPQEFQSLLEELQKT